MGRQEIGRRFIAWTLHSLVFYKKKPPLLSRKSSLFDVHFEIRWKLCARVVHYADGAREYWTQIKCHKSVANWLIRPMQWLASLGRDMGLMVSLLIHSHSSFFF